MRSELKSFICVHAGMPFVCTWDCSRSAAETTDPDLMCSALKLLEIPFRGETDVTHLIFQRYFAPNYKAPPAMLLFCIN